MSMSTEKGRIALAEAMGWTSCVVERDYPIGGREQVTEWTSPDGKVWDYLPFHPFTDANDDYAVLEWVRNQVKNDHGSLPSGKPRWTSSDKWWPFYAAVADAQECAYRVGDYARAALKVLDDD